MDIFATTTTNAVVLVFGLGGVASLVMAILLTLRTRLRQRLASRQANAELIATESERARLSMMLRSESHLLFVVNDGSEPLCELATLEGLEYVGQAASPFLKFCDALEENDAALIRTKIKELAAVGSSFSVLVTTKIGVGLDVVGRPSGALAMVWVRRASRINDELVVARQLAKKNEVLSESFSSLLGAGDTIAWLRDSGGNLLWVSAGYARAVEAESAEQAVADQVELLSASDRLALRDSVMASPECTVSVYAIVAGQRKKLELKVVSLIDGTICVMGTDISSLDEVRREFREHSKAYRQTLDAVMRPIAIFSADQCLDFYNQAYRDLWGLEDEFLAARPKDGQILDRLNAERKIPAQQDFSAWKNKQLGIYSAVELSEDWWYLPDGRTLKVVSRPHPFGGVLYLYEDQTENMKLRNDYREVLTVQRDTLNNLSEAVALFGSNGRLKLHNQAFCDLWDINASQLEDNPHIKDVSAWCDVQVASNEQWQQVIGAVTDLGERGRSLRVTARSERVIEVSTLRLINGDTLVTFLDVSDAARIESALSKSEQSEKEAKRMKIDFMTRVSKRFREPLTSVLGFAQLLGQIDNGGMNPRQYEYLDAIIAAAGELRSLVNDVIDLAAMDAGLLNLEISSVNLHDTFSKAVRELGSKIIEKKIRLDPDFSVEAMRVNADSQRLMQVFKHLLSNAVYFSSEGGKVQYGTREHNGQVIAWVQDFGCGIDPSLRDVIFDRFNSRPVDPEHRGAGLGLALVRQFMQAHQGSIKIESEVGRGTRVECVFAAPQSERPYFSTPLKANDDSILIHHRMIPSAG